MSHDQAIGVFAFMAFLSAGCVKWLWTEILPEHAFRFYFARAHKAGLETEFGAVFRDRFSDPGESLAVAIRRCGLLGALTIYREVSVST